MSVEEVSRRAGTPDENWHAPHQTGVKSFTTINRQKSVKMLLRSASPINRRRQVFVAVADHAKRLGGFRKICYLVAQFESDSFQQTDTYFVTVREAKAFAQSCGDSYYFYPIFEKRVPRIQFFPSCKDILSFLSNGIFIY